MTHRLRQASGNKAVTFGIRQPFVEAGLDKGCAALEPLVKDLRVLRFVHLSSPMKSVAEKMRQMRARLKSAGETYAAFRCFRGARGRDSLEEGAANAFGLAGGPQINRGGAGGGG